MASKMFCYQDSESSAAVVCPHFTQENAQFVIHLYKDVQAYIRQNVVASHSHEYN